MAPMISSVDTTVPGDETTMPSTLPAAEALAVVTGASVAPGTGVPVTAGSPAGRS